MSYLSRRMREDGWPRRRPGELTITISVDTSRFDAALKRVMRALHALAERAGVTLDPWQEAMLEAAYANPDAARRPAAPPARRHRQVLMSAPDDHGEILACLRDRAARGERFALLPDPANPTDGAATRLSWDVVVIDEFHRWQEAGRRPSFPRENLGIWPTPKGRE